MATQEDMERSPAAAAVDEVREMDEEDEEEDEEVELYSSEHTASGVEETGAPQTLARTYSSAMETLMFAPGRCLSKELLEQRPMLSVKTRYHEVTIAKPFGVFHLMQLIEKSIQVGALFTPKLYVPKEIWLQDQVKLTGIPLKMEVFHALKQGLEKTSMGLLLPSKDEAKAAFIKELDALLELAHSERVHLIRSFPFLQADKAAQVASPPPSSGESNISSVTALSSVSGAAAVAGVGIGKLTNLAFGFGRMVKKQAIAAVERVGAAQPTAVTINELEEYAATLCMFFNSTRSIEQLVGVSAAADGTQESVNASNAALDLDAPTLSKLKELAVFLDEVVMELVMRDVHNLLDTFLRRSTRLFGEFSVDQAIMKQHGSVTA